MDVSPAAMVSATLDMKTAMNVQQGQLNLLKKVTDVAEANVMTLLNSVQQQPPLATSGNLGTRLNVYA